MNEHINPNAFFPDYTGFLGDLRSERRGQELWKKLSRHPGSSIRQLAKDSAEQKAFYRFLSNTRIEERQLIEEAAKRMSTLTEGRHLLCVQDTCEVNLCEHKGRLRANSGLGRSDKSDTAHCFKLHPGLVPDASDFTPLGFSHIKIFHRPEEMPDRMERKYKRQPIEERESYKWIEVAEKSKEILKGAETVTFIEDREGDT